MRPVRAFSFLPNPTGPATIPLQVCEMRTRRRLGGKRESYVDAFVPNAWHIAQSLFEQQPPHEHMTKTIADLAKAGF